MITVIIILIVFFFLWGKIFARTKGITKKLGSPYLIKDGIQHYLSRRDLPLETIFSIAKQEIIFVSVSHEVVTRFEEELVIDTIHKGITITVLVLNPNSSHIPFKEKLFGKSVRNLKNKISEILEILCSQKNELQNNNHRLIIKTYDSLLEIQYNDSRPFYRQSMGKD